MATNRVTTIFNGKMRFTSKITGHDIIMDSSASDGGEDNGASPKQLMLASLAGCTGMDVVSILGKMKVEFSDFSIDVQASLTEEHPKTYDKVNLTYKIRLAAEDQAKMEKAVALSEEKYCGVSAMFRKFSDLKTEIVFLD